MDLKSMVPLVVAVLGCSGAVSAATLTVLASPSLSSLAKGAIALPAFTVAGAAALYVIAFIWRAESELRAAKAKKETPLDSG